jgi:hypothetical protein
MAKITKRGRYESKNKKDLNNVLIIQKPPQWGNLLILINHIFIIITNKPTF